MSARAVMTKYLSRRWVPAVLRLCACAATAAPPREVLVSREIEDLYRVSAGTFYIRTIGCHEAVFNERAGIRINISGKGGMLLFRTGKQCVIEKFLVEVEAGKLPSTPRFF